MSKQSLPAVAEVQASERPAPSVTVTFKGSPDNRPESPSIWYLPNDLGGQSYLISTRFDGTRGAVLSAFGEPTIEFSNADMEARGFRVTDLTLDTLLFVDPDLPQADRDRIATHLKTEFNPSGDNLFFLTESSLQALARLLGPDFRGAIVQVAESGFGHHRYVTTILIDLQRAGKVFKLGSE